MNRAVAVVVLGLSGCQAKVVDLGRVDAPVSVDSHLDAPTCRCRITPCRVAGDCALTGGQCGTDSYCVGDFGPCTTDVACQATITDSVCTTGTASTTACE